MLSALIIRRYATTPYAILDESEKTCNSTVSLDEVYLHHLGISIVLKLSRVLLQFCNLTKLRTYETQYTLFCIRNFFIYCFNSQYILLLDPTIFLTFVQLVFDLILTWYILKLIGCSKQT